ncbi:unnamed protein product [Schistosoma spindalis]|nr:unnamed protein product [Schistosoma spindale]
MTIPYHLNVNWVSPIITALSMSTCSSMLNLTSNLSHSISSSQIVTSSLSPSPSPSSSSSSSRLLMSCFPQIVTKLRASSCFPFERQSDNISLLSSNYPQININNTDNLMNHNHDNDDKPLDLTLKSFTTVKSIESITKKLDNENSRRKSNRTRSQTKKSISSTTMKITNTLDKFNSIHQDIQTNHQVEMIQQSECIISTCTNTTTTTTTTNISSVELDQNNWIVNIQDSIKINQSNQKHPRSISNHRRPFKVFSNRVPLISTELLLKSSKLIDPLLLGNTIDQSVNDDVISGSASATATAAADADDDAAAADDDDDESKSMEHNIKQKTTSSSHTSPLSSTSIISIPKTNKNNSKRKSRRSQSASAIVMIPFNQTEYTNDNNKNIIIDETLSTTKSLETLYKLDKPVDSLTTTTTRTTTATTTTTTTAQSIRSISSTPSCYSSYTELIDPNQHHNNNNNNNDSINIKHTDCNPRMRRFPEMTPSEVKDKAYWEKRVKNNEAARRSRRARKTKELSLKKYADNLEKINSKLIEEIDLLKKEILHLKSEKKSNSN